MLTLLSEAKFWSFRDDVVINDTDFGAYRYQDKKEFCESYYNEGKKDYVEKRAMTWTPNNKRPFKLRDSIKELEEQLNQHKVVYCHWRDHRVLQLMLSSGLFINICINVLTGDITRLSFDKFLVGKLLSECISQVICTRTHVLITYNDNQISLIHLEKPSVRRNVPEKLSQLDARVVIIEIVRPSGRRLERRMTVNASGDMVLIWWRCSEDEVYPWAPTVKDQDRANVHIYRISGIKLDLVCFYRTEQDPISVQFSKTHQNTIRTIEQKVSQKGIVTIESCTHEINQSKMQRIEVTSIPLQMEVCCHGFSPDDEKLLLGCIDGSVVLFDDGRGITHLIKAAFIPTMISWHLDGAIVMIANERSQFQFFDISLSCIKNQLISEDMTPSNFLDMASYFSFQPTLLRICWSKKPEIVSYSESVAQSDCFLLLLFDHGPLAILRLFGGTGIKGDFHNSGLTADILVHRYLELNQVDRAINLLLSLNWDLYGPMCLTSLHKISNHLLSRPLNAEREVQIQTALASFHVPLKPICYETEVGYGDQVKDITRRFFHHLIRYKSFEKAFCLAIDINDYDLFMDLYFCAKDLNDNEMADAAKTKAEESVQLSDSRESDHSTCSDSSCSACCSEHSSRSGSSCSSDECEDCPVPKFKAISQHSPIHPPLPHPNIPIYTPPLPFTLHGKPTEHILRDRFNDPPLPDLNASSVVHKSKMMTTDFVFPRRFQMPQCGISHFSDNRLGLSVTPSFIKPRLKSSSSMDILFQNKTKPPKALPRSINIPQHHVVDLIPKPVLNRAQSIPSVYQGFVPDQIIGLPLSVQSNYAYKHSNQNKTQKSESLVNIHSPLYHQYPLISGQIPRQSITMQLASKVANPQVQLAPKIPPPPSITNAMSMFNLGQESQISSAKLPGEKNKVKFSDTVTVAVVPEIPRKDKIGLPSERSRKGPNFYPMDPKRELADSLPLCHPNEDYLKDFTPIQDNKEDENRGSIKVVHFGVV